MKTTRKPIRNEALSGFFFGATQREYDMAAALGDQYLFAFVVLNSENDYERPFAVLLSLEEVEARTRTKRHPVPGELSTAIFSRQTVPKALIVFQPGA